jgi:phosphoglycolate phosphatase
MNSVLSRHGMPTHPIDDYRYYVGKGLEHLVRCVLPKNNLKDRIIDECLISMKLEYSKQWAKNSKPYPDIPELLTELEKTSLPMAILSNKTDEFTQIMINSLLPYRSFKVIRGFNPAIPPKPDPTMALKVADELEIQPGRILYLGDTDVDMQTANAAGMYAVGALWGFRTAEELRQNGAKALVESPLQVLNLINS